MSDYQQKDNRRGHTAIHLGGLKKILPAFPLEAIEQNCFILSCPGAKLATSYLYSFYLEPSIVGRVIVGWAALEEVFGGKSGAQRYFANHDINELRQIIKAHFGYIPETYKRLTVRMADVNQFPRIGLFERLKQSIAAECSLNISFIKDMIKLLHDVRNKIAHGADVGSFDYRQPANFIELVLRREIEAVTDRPIYSAMGGPLVNPLGTYVSDEFAP